MGHAKVLLSIEAEDLQASLANRVVKENLSVRELELLLRRQGASPKTAEVKTVLARPDLREVEERLRVWLGTPVKLVTGEKKSRLEITYFGDEGLERILEALGLSRGGSSSAPPRDSFRV